MGEGSQAARWLLLLLLPEVLQLLLLVVFEAELKKEGPRFCLGHDNRPPWVAGLGGNTCCPGLEPRPLLRMLKLIAETRWTVA